MISIPSKATIYIYIFTALLGIFRLDIRKHFFSKSGEPLAQAAQGVVGIIHGGAEERCRCGTEAHG